MRTCHKTILNPGDRFGNWTVVEYDNDESKRRKYSMYKCVCDCNPTVIHSIRGSRLTNGYTTCCQKCGFKKMSATKCGKNKYDLTHEYGIGWTTNTNEPFYFDLDDYDKIKEYTWYKNTTTGYVTTQSHNIRIDLQRFIMNAKSGEYVDHIHGNESKNDYRKDNLRIATKLQNNVNVGLRRNNTSGATGVRWISKRNKWQARIVFQRKQYTLGYYDNYNDAVNARKEAEYKYYGEFAYNISQQL